MASNARERIVAAAGELFAREGIKGSGVNAIIGASGVAKATFYRHFRSKDDVVTAWLETTFDSRVDEMLAAARASATTPAGRLDAIFDDLIDRLAKPDFAGFPFVNAAMEVPEAPSAVLNLVQRQLAATRMVLSDLAAEAGAADPAGTAEELQLLLLGLLVRARAEPAARVEAGRAARDAAQRLVSTPRARP